MNRRDFLKLIVGIPILGGLALFVSPLFRYLRPSSGPLTTTGLDTKAPDGKPLPPTEWQGNGGLFSQPDMPQREEDVVFKVGDFTKAWDFRTFTFSQKSKEYTFRHFQVTKIPGFVVRLPDAQENGQPDITIVSRICPHMGCVFNFLPDPAVLANYNYPQAQNPMFACPCHLSVYDPLQRQSIGAISPRGKVVSGPAPRPPRYFDWEIKGDQLVITAVESGGIS